MEKQTLPFTRMIEIYQFMMSQATSERALEYFKFDVPQDVEFISVWRGFVKDIAEALNIKKHLVDQAMVNLNYGESIRRVYKGSHGHPSIYQLIESPDQNKFMQMQERNHLTGRFKTLTPEQRLQDSITKLVNRVSALEDEVERLKRRVSTYDAIRNARR
jgi:hypothetical protein